MHLQIRNTYQIAALCSALAACSGADDPDWIVGTFSSRTVGEVGQSHVMPVEKFTFFDDGTGVETRTSACGGDVLEQPFTWESNGWSVSISKPGDQVDSQTNATEVRFVRGDGCTAGGLDQIQLQEVLDGVVVFDRSLSRADVCLAPHEDATCPEGFECNDCEIVWCDDAPLPCEE